MNGRLILSLCSQCEISRVCWEVSVLCPFLHGEVPVCLLCFLIQQCSPWISIYTVQSLEEVRQTVIRWYTTTSAFHLLPRKVLDLSKEIYRGSFEMDEGKLDCSDVPCWDRNLQPSSGYWCCVSGRRLQLCRFCLWGVGGSIKNLDALRNYSYGL